MPTIPQLSHVLSAPVVLQLADDNQDGLPDAGVLEAALAAAAAEVRAALRLAPETPLDPLPDDIALTLAVERLFERRREILPGPWAERAARARILLERLASGEHPSSPARSLHVEATGCTSPPLHTRSALQAI